jgi:dipeptidase D
VDIHKPRANANRLLGRALARLQAQEGVRLVSLKGGSAHNAIPRDAEAFLAVAPEAAPGVAESVAALERVFTEEHADYEPHLALRWEVLEAPLPARALTPESAARAVHLINALPHGVHGMSTHVAGLVETSCNLAILRMAQEALEIVSSQRSSVMSRMAEMTERVTAVAALAGASATRMNHHPAWAPDPDAALLRRCREIYRRLYDKEPVVEIIHAGLECGLIGDKLPGMEMISIGPNLKNPHSPEERLELPSVGRVYTFLATLLASY